MASIFLSYARADAEAVIALQGALVERGHDVWRDEANLPEASLWRDEIMIAIERSDVFLIAVSQASLRSAEVRREFERARDLGKRIIPVVIDGTSPNAAPPDLAGINWIGLAGPRALERIDVAINTDLRHLQQHTRLLIAAREWERDHRVVLRGGNLRDAEQWLRASADKEPAPTQLHRQLIAASRKAETRRAIALGVSAVVVAAIVVALVITWRRRAEEARRTLANRLAGESESLWGRKRYDEAMLKAVAAYQAAPTSRATSALLAAADRQPQLAVILHGHRQEVDALAFDPRRALLASGGGDDDGIHLFDTRSWKPVGTMGGRSPRISQLVFADDGSFLASGDWDGVIRRWDVVARKPMGDPAVEHRGIVESLALHPGGRFLAAGYSDGGVLWDLGAAPPANVPLPLAQSRRVNAVAFADDGKTLLAVEGTETLIGWAFDAGKLSGRHEAKLGRPIASIAAHGTTVVAGLDDGTLVWLHGPELAETRRTAAHPGAFIHALSFDGNGERLASASRDGDVRIWRADGGQPLLAFETSARVLAVAFDPRSSRVALSGSDPAIHVLDLAIRQPLAEVIHRFRARIEDVAFDGAGQSVMATTLDDWRFRIDVASRETRRLSDLAKEEGVSITTGREGIRVDGYTDGRVVVSRGGTSTSLAGAKLSYVMTLLFSPDGTLLFAGDNGGVVAAWETKSWRLSRIWRTRNTAAAGLAFSPDGRQLVVVDAGTPLITLIDPRASDAVSFSGKCERVFSAAFATDGGALVAGCDDGSLELFDVATRASLGILSDLEDPGEPDYVKALARHPREDVFAAGTEDGRVMLWTLVRAVWLRRACRRANRDLTEPVPGWSGAPLLPCSTLLLHAPSDEHKPDAEREGFPVVPEPATSTRTIAEIDPR